MPVNSERILDHAARYEARLSLGHDMEYLLLEHGLSEEVLRESRVAISMALRALDAIDADRARQERARVRAIGSLRNRGVAVLAGAMPERLFRPDDALTQWHGFRDVVQAAGAPDGLSLFERAAMTVASSYAGRVAPGIAMAAARAHTLRRVGGFVHVTKDETPENVVKEVQSGSEINLVVEAAASTAEAKRNLQWYIRAIRAGAKRIAIKPTALVPLSTAPIATRSSKEKLTKALLEIFSAADTCRLADGRTCEVSIDSEQSGLLEMTRDAVLNAAREFPEVRVKIAMQSYLNDTETRLLDPFLETSHQRVAAGGSPLGARLVCGANQVGEEWMTSANGWNGTPLVESRPAAHANYIRLMRRMTDPLRQGEFTVTLGTMNVITIMHNLIGLAKAGVFAADHGGLVSFSMLRGMTGPEVFRYLKNEYGVEGYEYVPVIPLERIVELFKYYLRRIEEIAGGNEEVANYLGVTCRHGHSSREWRKTQVTGFLAAQRLHETGHYPLTPGVQPNRGEHEPIIKPASLADFRIVPVINAGAPETRAWIDERISACRKRTDNDAPNLTLQWAPLKHDVARRKTELRGPTRPEFKLADVEYATQRDIDHAFELAEKDAEGWSKMPIQRRITIISGAVDKIREGRGHLLEALMLSTKKSVPEGDAEINEAMDFINLTVLQARELQERHHLEMGTEGNGTAVVVCPKNFPVAIPLAHIIARLIAGYRVIVKPSGGENEEQILPTYEMVKYLWNAGVPREALIFLPCDNNIAAYLTAHPKCERIGFTGSTATAEHIHRKNPRVDLLAETGGHNVAIVDSTADLKEVALMVVQNVLDSGGAEYSKPHRIIAIKGVNMERLQRHIDEIMEEITGHSSPELRVISMDGGIKEAVAMANAVPGSFAGALYSRSQKAIDHALAHWQTGNLSINSPITRIRADQGFCYGTGDSHCGAHGSKTGTPEFLLMNARVARRFPSARAPYEKITEDSTGLREILLRLEEKRRSSEARHFDLDAVIHAGWSCLYERAAYFSRKRPAPYQVIGQDDWIESKPIGHYTIRACKEDAMPDIMCKILAGIAAGNHVHLSAPFAMEPAITAAERTMGISLQTAFPNLTVRYETDSGFEHWVEWNKDEPAYERTACISYLDRKHVPTDIFRAAEKAGLHVDCRPVTGDGRVDMITQYRQQSYCWVHHTAGDDSFEQMRRERQRKNQE